MGQVTQGIVYIVYGVNAPFVPLEKSIEQIKKVCSLPITILSSRDINIPDVDVIKINVADDLREGEYTQCFKTKLLALDKLPYYSNIIIDSDTFFLEDPAQLISLDYDIAGCLETRWVDNYTKGKPHAPKFYFIYNSGFLIINNNSKWKALYKRACELYELAEKELLSPPVPTPLRHITDQWAINYSMLFDFDITAKIFPGRWNVRRPNIDKVQTPAMIHCRLYIEAQDEKPI
ncbi:hypothetical protein H8E06_01010 [bacterium]|nr:hypothetical protein [bacterium]